MILSFLLPKSYKDGVAQYKLGNYQTALGYFDKSVKIKPSHAESYFKLGMCYFKLKKWDQAYKHIKKAINLKPKKAEWVVQLKHSESKLKSNQARVGKKNNISMPVSNINSMTSYFNIYQTWLICQNTLALEKLFSFEDFLLSLNKKDYYHILVIKAEKAISENDQSLLSNVIQELETRDFNRAANYYNILLSYIKADYLMAINKAKYYCTQWGESPIISYIISSAISMKKDPSPEWEKIAWDALETSIKSSKRQISWRYLASHTFSLAQTINLVDLWNKCKELGYINKNNRAATNFLIDGLVQGKNFELAKKIAINFFEEVKSSENVNNYIKNIARYAEEDFHPEWFLPFENINQKLFLQSSERYEFVLLRISNILRFSHIEAFLIRKTLLLFKKNEFNKNFTNDLDIGVFGLNNLDLINKLLCESGEFLSSIRRDENSIRLKHMIGITVSIYAHLEDIDNKFYLHEYNGIIFKNKLFSLEKFRFGSNIFLIPNNLDDYLNEYFFNWQKADYDFDILLNSNNIYQIKNYDLMAIRILQTLSISIIENNNKKEKDCYAKLRSLGEVINVDKFNLVKKIGCVIKPLTEIYQCKPDVALYLSGLENVGYQGNMWIPILERLDVCPIIIIREERIAQQLISTNIPVFHMDNMRELELLEEVGIKTILYPANTQKNVQTLRFFKLQHFFINHGESDKVVNQSKVLMAYDKLLVAGPLAEQRLYDAGLPVRPNQVIHVGRPQVELMLNRIDNFPRAVKTILYAPTWEGFVEEANYSSVTQFGLDMLRALSKVKNIKVYFKPHPYTGYNKQGKTGYFLKEMLILIKNHQHFIPIEGNISIFDYMNQADLMITDISSVLNDYLYTWKPMILTNPQNKSKKYLHDNYSSTPATYILNNPDEIISLISKIESEDPLLETRKSICLNSLGNIPEGSLKRFNQVITDSVKSSVMI